MANSSSGFSTRTIRPLSTGDDADAGIFWTGDLDLDATLTAATALPNVVTPETGLSLFGSAGSDNLFGGTGNDVITGLQGNDTIDGGPGVNTSVYTGASTNYTLTVAAGGVAITLRDRAGTDGIDAVRNIQTLQFTDKTLDTSWFTKTAALSPGEIVDLTELYIASFNRAPDALGLAYWGARLKDGFLLQDIARSFFVQPETAAAYPAGQSTQDFITKVYNNVLNRAPDDGGLAYWAVELQSGSVSKDSFLLAIINGARGAADSQILANKELVGAHFALTQGLSNSAWAQTVMAGVNATSASVAAANAQTDGFAATAALANSAELVVQFVGIAP